jgi:hypothetical protein
MEHNYSNDYLDRMLNFAVSSYNYKPDDNKEQIPEHLTSLETAIDTFTEALQYESYQSLQQQQNSDSLPNPILYTVNLDSDEPGIVIGETKDNNKLLVHTKQKINDYQQKKRSPKTIDKMEKEAERSMTKLLEKQEKEKYETTMKNKNKKIKETEKLVKKIEKNEKKTTKLNNDIDKLEKIPNKSNKNEEKLQHSISELDKIKNEMNIMSQELDNNMKTYNQDKEDVSEYNMKKQLAKLEKQEKQKQKQENKDKNEEKNEDENNSEKEKKTKPKKPVIEKKHIIICDEESDILDTFHQINKEEENTDYNTFTESKKMDKKSISFYPSPVPLERHISAIHKCDPHPGLLPTLLYGKNIHNSHDMIKLYHGPPGTGKTYRLILELEKLLNNSSSGKILICAPSNIGVINLYQKATDFGIYGRLILGKDYQDFVPMIDDGEKINQRVYFSTISMREGKLLTHQEFNTIFIDEAAQCQEALVWGLLRKSVTKLYMAGDPMQLPALVSESGKNLQYGRSMMERLMSLGVPSELLDVQRRMNPLIAEFSNMYCYQGKLKSDYKGDNKGVSPLEIIDIKGKEKKKGNSYYNVEEGKATIDLVTEISKTFNNIVVISPYKSQCQVLEDMLSSSNIKNVKVHTLDSFQGKEADVIILSTVRTGTQIGFWNDYRRLNVGLTRAKHILRVIGNTDTWIGQEGPLRDFFYFISKN